MPVKRHQETLAVSGDGSSFAALKHSTNGEETSAEAAAKTDDVGQKPGVVHLDHDLDRSETDDPLKRAVERAKRKRDGGAPASQARSDGQADSGTSAVRNAPRSSVTKSTVSS